MLVPESSAARVVAGWLLARRRVDGVRDTVIVIVGVARVPQEVPVSVLLSRVPNELAVVRSEADSQIRNAITVRVEPDDRRRGRRRGSRRGRRRGWGRSRRGWPRRRRARRLWRVGRWGRGWAWRLDGRAGSSAARCRAATGSRATARGRAAARVSSHPTSSRCRRSPRTPSRHRKSSHRPRSSRRPRSSHPTSSPRTPSRRRRSSRAGRRSLVDPEGAGVRPGVAEACSVVTPECPLVEGSPARTSPPVDRSPPAPGWKRSASSGPRTPAIPLRRQREPASRKRSAARVRAPR